MLSIEKVQHAGVQISYPTLSDVLEFLKQMLKLEKIEWRVKIPEDIKIALIKLRLKWDAILERVQLHFHE